MPDAEYNIFSLMKILDYGYKLGGDSQEIWIEKGENKVIFDIKIETPKGTIFATYFKSHVEKSEVAAVMTDKKKVINVNTAHGLSGHINDNVGRKTIQYLGYHIIGQFLPRVDHARKLRLSNVA